MAPQANRRASLTCAHCETSSLQWVVPQPRNGMCTECNRLVRDGPLRQAAAASLASGRSDTRGVHWYPIRIVSGRKVWNVDRRYSDFLNLYAAVSFKAQQGLELPPMPPKSFFRKRPTGSFMQRRQKELQKVVDAILAADPGIESIPARVFFGLTPGAPTAPAAAEASLDARSRSAREMYAAGYTIPHLLEAGFRSREFFALLGFSSARELKKAGFTARHLRISIGYPARGLRALGFTSTELVEAGFSRWQLLDDAEGWLTLEEFNAACVAALMLRWYATTAPIE